MPTSVTGEPRREAFAAPAVVTHMATHMAPNFGNAFHELCLNESASAKRDLLNTTVALVRQLEVEGLPPERVIIAIKNALVRFGGCDWPHLYDTSCFAGECQASAYRSVLSWSLDAYFRTDQ